MSDEKINDEKNEIKIIVTEEESEPESQDTNTVSSEEEQNDTTEIKTVQEESNTLAQPKGGFGERRKSTLLEMDKRYAWMSELEEKYLNIETTFISKFQYVPVSNHCQKYLEKLSSDESMTEFRIEFSNLFDKFRTAFAGSQRLKNKLSEIKALKRKTDDENRKVKIKLNDQDREIEKLRMNLDNLKNDLLQKEREKAAIQKLLIELREEKIDDSKTQEQVTQSKPVMQMQDDEEAQEKINELEEQLALLGKEAEFIKNRESLYQSKIQQAENTKSSLEIELNLVRYELQKQTIRAEKAEAVVSQKSDELKNKNDTIKNMTEDSKKINVDLVTAKEESRRFLKNLKQCQKELDGSTQIMEKLKRDLEIREDRIKLLMTQKDSLATDLASKQVEIHSLKADVENVIKEKNSLSRRNATLEERSTDAEKKLENAKKENAVQQKELDLIRRELEESDVKTRELTKQKDILTEEVLKHEQTISEIQTEVKVLQEKCRNLERSLEKSQTFNEDLQKNTRNLEKAKDRLVKEIGELSRNISDLKGEIKRQQLNASKMKKTEEKLLLQLGDEQAKYKHLAEDERHCRKLLVEARHETEQLRDQQVVLQKHIEQLRDRNRDLDERQKKLKVNGKSLTDKLGNAKELHKQEVKNCEELNAKLKLKDDHEQLLLKNLADMENTADTLRRKVKNSLEEKNVQNSKLVEKDREINDLKENARLLQQEVTALDRSLNDRINDIKLLKIQISQMNRSNALMNEQVMFVDTIRQELIDAQGKLVDEKLKSKVLESEVQNPVNLHRWRILEGIDPERVQLIVKNQELQKQLIRRMSELDSKDIELKQKDRLTQELQEQLNRRSETNIQEQLWICKKELGLRTDRLKCLTAENSMFQKLSQKYEYENSALKNELKKYKLSDYHSKAKKRKAI